MTENERLELAARGFTTSEYRSDGTIKVTIPSQGTKNDQGKVPMELLPMDAITEIAKVLQFGAKKYAPNNWRKGLAFTRVLGATLRHLFAWSLGEDLDPETGLSHLAHAGCEILFLLHFEKYRVDLDDRYKPERKN